MNPKLQLFASIMAFYIALSYVFFPAVFFYFVEKSLSSAGNGFALGSIISVGLWYTFGAKMVN